MSRIVVPLDESPLAEEALPWAAAIAHARDLPIHLVSVYRSEPHFWEFADFEAGGSMGQAVESVPAYLDALTRRPPLTGLRVTTEVRDGDVAEQILAVCQRGDTELVAITTRGKGGFEGAGRGSVADKLVRTLPVPVLVVPPDAREASLENILVTLDGSKAAEAALQTARELSAGSGARLHLLRVIDLSNDWRVVGQDVVIEQLALRGERYVRRVAREGEVPVVLHGRAAPTIQAYARGNRCQLIVMATHGWSGPIRLELGSIADQVMRTADRPVLLVRILVE